jgi:XrtJ-associated TM-motif-TM protein
MHKKSAFSLIAAASLFALTVRSAFAQISGCVDSPEDPTVVMALLGGGAAAVQFVWSRFRARRRQK